MTWTGTIPPQRMIVKTTYEDGQLVRQQTEVHLAGGGWNFTDVRCTCEVPEVGCTLHGKEPARRQSSSRTGNPRRKPPA